MSQFNAKHFQTPEAAREYLEALRWGDERVCPHCGSLNSFATKKAGIYRCREKECRKDFSGIAPAAAALRSCPGSADIGV